jgi:hypothetical protein
MTACRPIRKGHSAGGMFFLSDMPQEADQTAESIPRFSYKMEKSKVPYMEHDNTGNAGD